MRAAASPIRVARAAELDFTAIQLASILGVDRRTVYHYFPITNGSIALSTIRAAHPSVAGSIDHALKARRRGEGFPVALHTVKAVAGMLDRSEQTIRNMIERGDLPSEVLGGRTYVTIAALVARVRAAARAERRAIQN